MPVQCVTRHLGPITLRRGAPATAIESDGGGSSCLVSLSGPVLQPNGVDFVNWQGVTAALLGLQGSVWVPLRRGWAPAFTTSTRQLLQYQGAAVQKFRVELSLQASGFDPSDWALEVPAVSCDITTGDAGSSGPAPGGSFLLTSRVGVLPAGSDFPQVSAMPERRRLTVELLATTGLAVGCAWIPSDATPATWVPLAVGVPRTFETSAPLWIASDPPASPSDISVIEEMS